MVEQKRRCGIELTVDSVTWGKLWGEEVRLKIRNDRIGWMRRCVGLIVGYQKIWLLLLFLLCHTRHTSVSQQWTSSNAFLPLYGKLFHSVCPAYQKRIVSLETNTEFHHVCWNINSKWRRLLLLFVSRGTYWHFHCPLGSQACAYEAEGNSRKIYMPAVKILVRANVWKVPFFLQQETTLPGNRQQCQCMAGCINILYPLFLLHLCSFSTAIFPFFPLKNAPLYCCGVLWIVIFRSLFYHNVDICQVKFNISDAIKVDLIPFKCFWENTEVM